MQLDHFNFEDLFSFTVQIYDFQKFKTELEVWIGVNRSVQSGLTVGSSGVIKIF